MPELTRLKGLYEDAKKTGCRTPWGLGQEYAREQCQETYDFIMSGRMPERMIELPEPLQWDLWDSLEVLGRHPETATDAAPKISRGISPMNRTAKDVDAACKDAAESGQPDPISALKNKLLKLRRSMQCSNEFCR